MKHAPKTLPDGEVRCYCGRAWPCIMSYADPLEVTQRLPELHIETATGALLDALMAIPLRPYGMTDAEVRAKYYGIYGQLPPREMIEGDL